MAIQRYPVDEVYVTQRWGENSAIYKKFGLKGHNGVDFRLHQGYNTPIYAPHDGEIIEARYDANGYGEYAKIENAQEGSILAHFRKGSLNVDVGQMVKAGDLIGYGGNTGNSTGPHLHWGYYRKPRDRGNGYSGTQDQIPLMNELGGGDNDSNVGTKYEWIDNWANPKGVATDEGNLREILEHGIVYDRDVKNLQAKVKELEGKLEVADSDIGELEYQVIDLSSQLEDKISKLVSCATTVTQYGHLRKVAESMTGYTGGDIKMLSERLQEVAGSNETTLPEPSEPVTGGGDDNMGETNEYPNWKKALKGGWRVFYPAFLAIVLAQLSAGVDMGEWQSWLPALIISAVSAGVGAVMKYLREEYGQQDYSKLIYKVF